MNGPLHTISISAKISILRLQICKCCHFNFITISNWVVFLFSRIIFHWVRVVEWWFWCRSIASNDCVDPVSSFFNPTTYYRHDTADDCTHSTCARKKSDKCLDRRVGKIYTQFLFTQFFLLPRLMKNNQHKVEIKDCKQ